MSQMGQGVGEAERPSQLLRVLGVGFGLAVVIGGVIGQGIFRAPGVVAAGLPDAKLALAAWVLGGLAIAIDAMPTVELGAAIPRAGGPYALAHRAFGPLVGFMTGWADWLQIAASTGFISVVFGEYVHRFGIATAWPTGLIAAGLIVACVAVNWVGTRFGGASQNLGSAVKTLGLLVLVGCLFFAPRAASVVPPPGPSPVLSWTAAVLALRAIYGAYGGWHTAVYFSEEVHEPQRNVARATFSGIALVTVLYVLVNAAVFTVLPATVVAKSTLAVADAARVVMGPVGSTVVTALAMLSVAAIANLQVMFQTRTTFAMARNGVFPPALAKVAPGGTPRRSLLVVFAFSVAFAATGVYERLLSIYTPLAMLTFFLLGVASMVLRRREPELARPWRMPLYPLPALFSCAVNGALLVIFLADDPVNGLLAALLLVLPLPLYVYGAKRWRAMV